MAQRRKDEKTKKPVIIAKTAQAVLKQIKSGDFAAALQLLNNPHSPHQAHEIIFHIPVTVEILSTILTRAQEKQHTESIKTVVKLRMTQQPPYGPYNLKVYRELFYIFFKIYGHNESSVLNFVKEIVDHEGTPIFNRIVDNRLMRFAVEKSLRLLIYIEQLNRGSQKKHLPTSPGHALPYPSEATRPLTVYYLRQGQKKAGFPIKVNFTYRDSKASYSNKSNAISFLSFDNEEEEEVIASDSEMPHPRPLAKLLKKCERFASSEELLEDNPFFSWDPQEEDEESSQIEDKEKPTFSTFSSSLSSKPAISAPGPASPALFNGTPSSSSSVNDASKSLSISSSRSSSSVAGSGDPDPAPPLQPSDTEIASL